VITIDAVSQATTFTVSGADDQCGAPVAAAVTGTAHVNLNGSVSLGLLETRPDGLTLATSAELSLATLSGVWKDDSGNSGTFVFNPPAAPGEPRRITLTGVYSAGLTAAQANNGVVSNISFPRRLPAPPAVPEVNIIPADGQPTVNCPGSVDNPRALPGQLCLYEQLRGNVALFRITNSDGVEGIADTTGAHFAILATAPGNTQVIGKWAVTIP
jgi:hypothetical protein